MFVFKTLFVICTILGFKSYTDKLLLTIVRSLTILLKGKDMIALLK